MRVWLLQSKEGGLTCGHLHVHEAQAWRCLDTQADPEAWVVLYSYLHQPSGERPKPDGWLVASGLCLLLIGLAFGLLMVGGLIHTLMHNDLWDSERRLLVTLYSFGMLGAGAWVFMSTDILISDIRRPTTTGWGGWDWF